MNTQLFRSCIVTAGALILPGCLAINAILGVAGLLTSGPIQYAGTAYSIGEYSYEYAVNDKTPDEVIEEKLVWLFDRDESPATQSEPSMQAAAKTLKPSVAMVATSAETPTRVLAPETFSASLTASSRVTLRPQSTVQSPPKIVASIDPRPSPPAPSPAPIVRPRRAASQQHAPTTVAAIPAPQPQHTYVTRKNDPLLIKLARLEQSLAQAELIMNQKPIHGIRYTVSPNEAGQTEAGISGSWSIRHDLMQSSPIVQPAAVNSVVETTLPETTQRTS